MTTTTDLIKQNVESDLPVGTVEDITGVKNGDHPPTYADWTSAYIDFADIDGDVLTALDQSEHVDGYDVRAGQTVEATVAVPDEEDLAEQEEFNEAEFWADVIIATLHLLGMFLSSGSDNTADTDEQTSND